jgi:hypothetical protein
LILLPFKFGHRNNGWGVELPLGQTIGCWANSLYVAITIHKKMMSIHITSYNINVPSFGYTLTIPQNQPNKQLQQMFFSKSTLWSSKHLLIKKFFMQKYPNLKSKPFGNIG